MADEEQPARAKSPLSRVLWLLVLVAVVALWWYFRAAGATVKVAQAPDARDGAGAEATAPGEILVDLKDDVTPAQVAALEHDLGIALRLDSDEAKAEQLYVAEVDPAREDAILDALSKRPEVEIAEPDQKIQLSRTELEDEAQEVATPPAEPTDPGFPNDPRYGEQWHLRQIGMPQAWKLAQGNGVIVAVLDTGVAYENYKQFHQLPDLTGIAFVDGYNFIDNTPHANDDHGHGSHVTGTIAQATNNGIGVAGVALNVKIMPIKVLSKQGSGSIAGIADGIRFAADHGAKVINMSLGGPFPSRELKKAVEYAHDKGVVVVCAAGNESRNKVGYPAAYPGAIAVSATQDDEDITFYSNTGKDIDIAGPGGNTRSADGGRNNTRGGVLQNTIVIGDPTKDDYFAFMGTSMASPHVAGVAALVVGEGVTNPDQVEKILKDSARKPQNKKFTAERYGAGIVDAPAAILRARSATGGFELGLGVLLAGAVVASARRRGRLGVTIGAGYFLGVLVGASGLFFLPYLAPGASSLPIVHALTSGLPSWDLSVLGVGGHGNALFFSALIPLALLAVGYGVPRLRGVLAGVAVGVAAHLLFHAVVPLSPLHVLSGVAGGATVWLVGNALACLGLARLALRR
jgi:serine protease